MTFVLVLLVSPLLSPTTLPTDSIPKTCNNLKTNKTIPTAIEAHVLTALSYYPELKETAIRFVFTPKLKRTTMAARPVFGTLFKSRDKRAYEILINPTFKLGYHEKPVSRIPDSVIIGWLGHELGHIVDYEQRRASNLVGFGASYSLSRRFIAKAEHTADSFAVARGMAEYIVATKTFILNHAGFPQPYKDRIASLYLSSDDIMELSITLEERLQSEGSAEEHEAIALPLEEKTEETDEEASWF